MNTLMDALRASSYGTTPFGGGIINPSAPQMSLSNFVNLGDYAQQPQLQQEGFKPFYGPSVDEGFKPFYGESQPSGFSPFYR